MQVNMLDTTLPSFTLISTLLKVEALTRLLTQSDILDRLTKGEQIAGYEARLRCKDGSVKHVLIDSSVFRSPDGQFIHTRCFTRDISERKRIELELARAKESAEQALRAKDLFLGMLSHELRTPLMPVVMTLSALQENDVVLPHVREQLAVALRHVDLEIRLIDDLLDTTAISRGRGDCFFLDSARAPSHNNGTHRRA